MKVSHLKAKTRTIFVDIPGDGDDPDEKIEIVYRPGELTLEVSDEIKAAIQSGFESDIAFAMLRRVLVRWDLQNDDGTELDVSDDSIKTIPLTFLGLILQAIEDDSRPNPKRGATSGDGSSQTELQEASQTGTSSSEHQTGSLVGPGSS